MAPKDRCSLMDVARGKGEIVPVAGFRREKFSEGASRAESGRLVSPEDGTGNSILFRESSGKNGAGEAFLRLIVRAGLSVQDRLFPGNAGCRGAGQRASDSAKEKTGKGRGSAGAFPRVLFSRKAEA